MFALTTALMSLIGQVSGTPYIPGGDTPAGTDCSGLASWVANVASGRPAFGSRFNTGNMESALLSRGFRYGTAPDALVIGWNGGHAAVTLPDGTPVSSGESGTGVRIGGGGAYQPQFTNHMYLPIEVTPEDPDPAGAIPEATAPTPAPPAAEAPPAEPPPAEANQGPVEAPPAEAPPGGQPGQPAADLPEDGAGEPPAPAAEPDSGSDPEQVVSVPV